MTWAELAMFAAFQGLWLAPAAAWAWWTGRDL